MQENWIGKSRGMKFRFALDAPIGGAISEIEVFTTRPDTIFGASFVALSPDHPLAQALAADATGGRRLHRPMQAGRHHRGRAGDGGEAGLRHRARGRPSARSGVDAAGLHRQFRADGLRHRRDLRRAGARPARLRFRHANTACRSCASSPPRPRRPDKPIGDEAESGDGVLVNSRFLDGMERRGRPRRR